MRISFYFRTDHEVSLATVVTRRNNKHRENTWASSSIQSFFVGVRPDSKVLHGHYCCYEGVLASYDTELEPYVLLTKVGVANNVVGADEVGKHNLDDAIDIHCA